MSFPSPVDPLRPPSTPGSASGSPWRSGSGGNGGAGRFWGTPPPPQGYFPSSGPDYGGAPLSAPPLSFPHASLVSPTPPQDASSRPTALRFSTPRSRRPLGAEEDVEALCAQLSSQIRALELSRQAQGEPAQSPRIDTTRRGGAFPQTPEAALPVDAWGRPYNSAGRTPSPAGNETPIPHPTQSGTAQAFWENQRPSPAAVPQFAPRPGFTSPSALYQNPTASTPTWAGTQPGQQGTAATGMAPNSSPRTPLGAAGLGTAAGAGPASVPPTYTDAPYLASPVHSPLPPFLTQQYGNQLQHPSSAPPHLGASPWFSPQHQQQHTPEAAPALSPAELWSARLLPSPSQLHIRSQQQLKKRAPLRKEPVEPLVPMGPTESDAALRRLGVLPWLEEGRDAVRQWFASDLLRSFAEKIKQTPREVTAAAAGLGLTFELSPLCPGLDDLEDSSQERAAQAAAEALFLGPSSGPGAGSGSSDARLLPLEESERTVVLMGVALPEGDALQQLMWSLQHVLQVEQQRHEAEQTRQMRGVGPTFHLPTQALQQEQQQHTQDSPAAVRRAIRAVEEYQKLKEVLSGKWGSGLMPRGGIPTAYMLRRFRELAQGSCVKNFRWNSGGDYALEYSSAVAAAITIPEAPGAAASVSPSLSVRPITLLRAAGATSPVPLGAGSPWRALSMPQLDAGGQQQWPANIPTDSLLLAYLFCVHLAHPGWAFSSQLHQGEARVGPGAPPVAGTAPLFVGGVLPDGSRGAASRRFLGVVQEAQGVLTGNADVLVISNDVPPIFALYWDQMLQFCSQGRAALWDTIIVLMERIRMHHLSLLGSQGTALPMPTLLLAPVSAPLLKLLGSLDAAKVPSEYCRSH